MSVILFPHLYASVLLRSGSEMKKVTVQLIDDLDGTVIEEGSGRAIEFSLDGDSFTIDLSRKNEERLREALAPFVDAAQTMKKSRKATKPTSSDPSEIAVIRQWAAANGFEVSDRGRISGKVRDAFQASI
jgi:hypothetical protein